MRLAAAAITLCFLAPIYGQQQEAQLNQHLNETSKKWGIEIFKSTDSKIKLRLGSRLQSVTESKKITSTNPAEDISIQDMYLRRIRFQFESIFMNDWRYYMDVRNDNSNKKDKGDGSFIVGDEFIERKNIFGIEGLSTRFFRSKVELSRSQTIGSAKLIYVDRAYISDEAAAYVSDGRRAANFQLNGTFDYWHFQVVAGDGVQSKNVHDAKGNDLSDGEVRKQNFMVGTHIMVYPLTGWDDKKPTETYFGKGKHLSFGGGVFHTGSIQYSNAAQTQVSSISRTLMNAEFSFHYKRLSFQSEYFRFNGVVEDFNSNQKNVGSSNGQYAQAEYYLSTEYNVAPFIRYESWDRFKQKEGYDLNSVLVGLNWYYLQNRIRFGLSWQKDKYGSQIRESLDSGAKISEEEKLRLTTMWHF